MSATVPDRLPAARAPTAGPAASLRATGSAIVALACAAAGLTIAQAHPLWPLLAVGGFVGWCVLAAVRTPIALAGLFALLPIIDFAPRTGWLIFEEFDLLLLATAAGGYAARVGAAWSSRSTPKESSRFLPGLTVLSLLLVLVYLATELVSMQRGMAEAGGFRFDWTQGYNDPLNSLRILKGLAWAVLMLPLLTAEVGSPRGLDRIGSGLTIALGLGALVVLQERLAFTGLLDFSQDYRATGPFWEMHVGGASLDGFLVLTVPFAIREALHARRVEHFAAVAAVLALAAYATLVTFSRGLWLSIPIGLATLTVLWVAGTKKRGGPSYWPFVIKGTLLALCVAAGSVVVFRGGGYRALLATFMVFALGFRAVPWMRRASASTWTVAMMAAAVLGAAGYLVASALPKGPYLVFAMAFTACAAACAATVLVPAPKARLLPLAVIATWLWSAIAGCVVAGGWGGRHAGIDSAMVLATWVVLVGVSSRMKRSPWPDSLRVQLGAAGIAALVMAAVAALTGGAYMGGRLASGRGDLQVRVDHWVEGIDRLRGVDDWLFGMGLGRFPATSLFANTVDSAPGSYRVFHRDGETFLSLYAPRLRYLGTGELFRFTQVVSVRPKARYTLTIVARSDVVAALNVEVCEKHLIYSATCASVESPVPAGEGRWTTQTMAMQIPDLATDSWIAVRPLVFTMAVTNPGVKVDIRSVSLVGPDGGDVLANGRFTRGTERWFSSADMNHRPFHIFNLPLGVLFDQGLIGLGLLTLLVAGALLRTVLGRAHRHPDAPFVAAALVAFLVVGAFDNLIDAPRIAFLFHVVVLLGLMLRNPRVETTSPAAPRRPAPVDTRADEDEAAARALRRQQAFGPRRPPAA